jgi:hypothetical protein
MLHTGSHTQTHELETISALKVSPKMQIAPRSLAGRGLYSGHHGCCSVS